MLADFSFPIRAKLPRPPFGKTPSSGSGVCCLVGLLAEVGEALLVCGWELPGCCSFDDAVEVRAWRTNLAGIHAA